MRRFGWALLSSFRRPRYEEDMQAEFQDHVRARMEHLIEQGVAPSDAELQARREFGTVEAIKEECRESTGLAWIDACLRDLRFATRVLRKSPAFSSAAILILALCIGANTAIFSVVDAALFRALPYPEPEKLAMISRFVHSPRSEFEATAQNGRTWEYLHDNVQSLDLAVTAREQGVNLAISPAQAIYVRQKRVSAGYFRAIGIHPMMGREFDDAEDRPGGPPLVMITASMWHSAFGSDPSILGRGIHLRGEPYTVIGVLPPDFRPVPPADVWTPLRPSTSGEGSGANYEMIGRIRPGYRWEQADAELANLSAGYFASQKLPDGVSIRFHLLSHQRGRSDGIRQAMFLLWATVGLVLLLGCVNIAGLMLARGGARRHEIATRMALGSSRWSIARQLLTEGLMLALSGGAAGLAIGYAIIAMLGPALARTIGFDQIPQVDIRVALATLTVALTTTFLFGVYPAWNLTRMDVRSSLASASRTSSASRRRPRQALVVCEVALGVVLLAGAGVVLRTLQYLTNLEPGFDGANVMTASLSLEDARYASGESIDRLFATSLDKLRENPAVEAAGVGLTLPYERALNETHAIKDGPRASAEKFTTNVVYVTPGFMEALRMRLVAGRWITAQDRRGAPEVALINEAFAKRFFHDDNPLGRHVDNAEVIGIVADTQQKAGWGNFGPMGRVPTVYIAAAQCSPKMFAFVHGWFSPSWVVRTRGPQPDIARVMQQAVASVDPLLPFAEFRAMDEIHASSLNFQRAETWIFGSIAGLALLLAAVGIWGLMAQSITERTREFGVRMALGASRARMIVTAARQGIVLSAAGLIIGCGFAMLSGGYVRTLVWIVPPNDPVVFASVAIGLLLVALLASVTPSLRIARIDPADTLRAE